MEAKGTLEVLAVAVLLSALGAFASGDRRAARGRVAVHAARQPAHFAITVRCADADGQPLACRPLDKATCWLLGRVAQGAGGAFECLPDPDRPECLAFRLGRQL